MAAVVLQAPELPGEERERERRKWDASCGGDEGEGGPPGARGEREGESQTDEKDGGGKSAESGLALMRRLESSGLAGLELISHACGWF